MYFELYSTETPRRAPQHPQWYRYTGATNAQPLELSRALLLGPRAGILFPSARRSEKKLLTTVVSCQQHNRCQQDSALRVNASPPEPTPAAELSVSCKNPCN
ncbi:uncharacterized protein TrAtP1_006171 [Trichoderma atroviride]|uniref:uncharacterized protein n=1 Tax=Hypocrea atroviridis TaxID=63577 RepID=UPI003333BAE4|nr:hypothetical protein TrAtP1_006171 [Trichoderma atroviride]